MMQRFLKLVFLFLFAVVHCQEISDYQKIFIPEQFADSKANKYELGDVLSKQLKSKKFLVNSESLNIDCETLKAEISDDSTMFTNRALITFLDCNNKVVATYKGKSSIKEFEPGMRNAVENAVKSIPFSKSISINAVKIIPEKEIESKVKSEKNQKSSAENFTNGKLTLNKVLLANGEFIFVNPNDAVPYAIFKLSTKKDIYRVQLSDGSFTLGYLENGKIIVELINTDGSLHAEIFHKK